MSFAVVEFIDDNSIDAVPSNWIEENHCCWPPFRGLRFTSAIRKREQPLPTWTQHNVRILKFYSKLSLTAINILRF
jgi:hypothetical protein